MEQKKVVYYLSAKTWGDGKSVCLWRSVGNESEKIARFQSDKAARKFATDFNFPLSENVVKFLLCYKT